MYDVDIQAIREAERTVLLAKWRYLEEAALASLAARRGLAWTPLFPPSQVIQLVAYDGDLLGRVRQLYPRRRWVATPHGGRPLGPFRSIHAAAKALLR